MKQVKLGHQAPKGWKVNKFNSVEIDGDFAYCYSHNFLYNAEEEDEKLHNGLPCYYTDGRFHDTPHNYYKHCYLHWTRWKDISLKACIRRTLSCRNIPVETIVNFKKSWYFVGKRIDNSFNFKIKKENKLDIKFEVNKPSYFKNFTNCEFSKELTNKLRENGFLVSVFGNTSFLGDMINTASAHMGNKDFKDTTIDGEIAVAYGHGIRVGFSSFNNDYRGYSNGCDSVLWDKFDEFNKWSQCNEILKTESVDDIIKILKEKE